MLHSPRSSFQTIFTSSSFLSYKNLIQISKTSLQFPAPKMSTLAGKSITANGLGLMRTQPPSTSHPPTNNTPGFRPNDPSADSTVFPILKAALSSGANLWNGTDFYGTPTSNSLHLMSRYFAAYPADADKVVLCIKSGIVDMKSFKMDCSPAAMRKSVENANSILGGKKKIDVFGPARVDPDIPIEETVSALAELVKEGKISGIQLSEVSASTIRRAAKVTKIEMVESEISLWAADVFSNGVADTCAELGIVMVAHTPLGAGMLAGKFEKVEDLGDDHHKFFPRFMGENFGRNLELVREIGKVAGEKGCSRAQLALAWVRRGNGRVGWPWIVPVAGAGSLERVGENCEDVGLSEDEERVIGGILERFPVVGERYPAGAAKLAEY
jgi:pyridoxine 4-dehydrogenase